MQIQEDFSGAPLGVLAESGLEVYDLIPDYRDRCPICRGANCAVRHGLYHRRVVDRDGKTYGGFPVPRFRCQHRGPRAGEEAATFSVLPAEPVSRRRLSLPCMLWILELLLGAGSTVQRVLDVVAEDFRHPTWYPEPHIVYRIVRLFADADSRWGHTLSAEVDPLPGRGEPRARAGRVFRLLTKTPRAGPMVLHFHQRHFPRLLFAPKVCHG